MSVNVCSIFFKEGTAKGFEQIPVFLFNSIFKFRAFQESKRKLYERDHELKLNYFFLSHLPG